MCWSGAPPRENAWTGVDTSEQKWPDQVERAQPARPDYTRFLPELQMALQQLRGVGMALATRGHADRNGRLARSLAVSWHHGQGGRCYRYAP